MDNQSFDVEKYVVVAGELYARPCRVLHVLDGKEMMAISSTPDGKFTKCRYSLNGDYKTESFLPSELRVVMSGIDWLDAAAMGLQPKTREGFGNE